ncbi:MAG: hypothetical protein JW940_31035 [Polyangiaceae bacterium]|nr:hypothetical protein [Polyangiaceae bacterium]
MKRAFFWNGSISTMTAALVLAGCTSDGDSSSADSTTGDTIGVDGGEASGGGAKVTIPSGALSSSTQIEVAKVDVSDAEVPGDLILVSDAIAFTPHGTKFKKAVTLGIPYDSSASHLVLLRLDNEEDTAWASVSGGQFDDGTATLDVKSFSVYAVGAEEQSSATGGAGNPGAAGAPGESGGAGAPSSAGGPGSAGAPSSAGGPGSAGAPSAGGAPGNAGAPNATGGLAGAGGTTSLEGNAGADSGSGGSPDTQGFDIDAYCSGICEAQVALDCSATDYDQASCAAYCVSQVAPNTPCYAEHAGYYQCLFEHRDSAFECDEEGDASVIDGTCDDELAAYVTCLMG